MDFFIEKLNEIKPGLTLLITDYRLWLSFLLLGILSLINYLIKMQLGNEILYSSFRGFIQLILVGLALTWIFSIKNPLAIIGIFMMMILIASRIAEKRSQQLRHVFLPIALSLSITCILIMGFVTLTKSIQTSPEYVLTFGGMLIGNCMVASSLALDRMLAEVKLKEEQILLYLSLGASPYQAIQPILRSCLKTALIPALDNTKALGIIVIPGLMSGMIIAGADPMNAVKNQIILINMILVGFVLCNLLVILLCYPKLFNKAQQLKTVLVNP